MVNQTGARDRGPQQVQVSAPRAVTPIYARVGGLVLTTAEMLFTTAKPWDPVVADVFVPKEPTQQTRVVRG